MKVNASGPQKTNKCPTPGPVMMGVHQERKEGRIWRPSCKRWSCPVCGPERAREWGFVALVGAVKLAEDKISLHFVTMTSHEKLSNEQALAAWPSAWKKLHTRINRKYGKGQYFMVTEQHRSGKLHVHGIVTWPMPKWWLKKNARECGLGYQAWADEINDPGIVVGYVAKYLTKQNVEWPKRWRRVRMSRDWPKLDAPEGRSGWRDWMLGEPTLQEVENHVKDYASAGYDMKIAEGMLDGLKTP